LIRFEVDEGVIFDHCAEDKEELRKCELSDKKLLHEHDESVASKLRKK
jgi:hypothetical protein